MAYDIGHVNLRDDLPKNVFFHFVPTSLMKHLRKSIGTTKKMLVALRWDEVEVAGQSDAGGCLAQALLKKA